MSYYSYTFGKRNKERILKTAREKHQVIYKFKPIKIAVYFSIETLKSRRA
jgi:hypothetical protein